MTQSSAISAELLAVSGSAYAAEAAQRLLESLPEIQTQVGNTAFRDWKEHLKQRIDELSAALTEDEPKLFVASVDWIRNAFGPRQMDDRWLRSSLVCLRDVLNTQLPDNAKEAPLSYLEQGLHRFEQPAPAASPLEAKDAESRLALQYLATVLEGNSPQAIDMILQAVQKGLPVKRAYQSVLIAAQREIGRMWHANEVTVAEEHFVTSTTQRTMAILCHQTSKARANDLTVVSACVAGNIHDMAIRAVSDLFEIAGWRAICLGGASPAAEIANGVRCFNASFVLLSAALSTHLGSLRKSILAIRELPEINCKIVVGGMVFDTVPHLWRQLGADGYAADFDEALALGNELLPQ